MAEEATSEGPKKLKVSRCPNFVQLYADEAVSVRAPRSLELAFVKQEVVIQTMSLAGDGDPIDYEFEPAAREIGRVTLPIPVAVSLAMDILFEIAPSGALRVDAVEADIKKILKTARDADEEKASGNA